MKIVSIQIIPYGDTYQVAVIFNNGNTSTMEKGFGSYERAKDFVEGMWEGMKWQTLLVSSAMTDAIKQILQEHGITDKGGNIK